ncbi:hypothetical protein HMPREF0202_01831 [Cetobacterium somerae ATCC BAA-474]|uniref:LysM domain-containing protein n=1 Tax=Cetobacterium somerae ATCC BAA-474 TaxID=1319815 RepID=U7V9U9_9FUSO|nr:LysM domain-containing protein [Cetobacterium somerae]ERT68261.1 hypothetical protein HMPREF0202_01831 [Cetobacterium somerae ATCC BAA-474]
MKKNIFIVFISMILSLYGKEKKLEYEVKYSENNFIVVSISKARFPTVMKKYHIVEGEEDLEDISEEYKIKIDELEKINKLSRFDKLRAGQIIYLIEQNKGGGV